MSGTLLFCMALTWPINAEETVCSKYLIAEGGCKYSPYFIGMAHNSFLHISIVQEQKHLLHHASLQDKYTVTLLHQ